MTAQLTNNRKIETLPDICNIYITQAHIFYAKVADMLPLL